LPATPAITENNGTLTSSPSILYQWYLDSTIIPGATYQSYITSQNGDYQVRVTDANGCSSLSAVFTYLQTGMIENTGSDLLTLYPDPTTGIINLNAGPVCNNNDEVTVYNSLGKIMMKEKGARALDLSSFTNGIYYIMYQSENLHMIIKKIILIK
jgi:hypothetical protein